MAGVAAAPMRRAARAPKEASAMQAIRPIRTILCPVDFTPICEHELTLASQLAERFDAALVVQHNLATGAGLGVSWMHEKEHHADDEAKEAAVRAQMTELLAKLPPTLRSRTKATITYGALDHCVQNLAEQADIDLIVIGTHGRSSAEHVSETERLLTHGPCPVLTTHDDAPHEWLPALDESGSKSRIHTLVPIDFSEHSRATLHYTLDLAEHLPLDVTALYVAQSEDIGADWVEEQLADAVGGRRESVKLELAHGDTADEILVEERLLDAHLVVMGTHAKGLFERIASLGRSTARELLHRSPCPVWFVPASASA
jgi:nucleotide-binding universal stress UspA family protein